MSMLTPHQKSALDFKDHLSLTANAGSGKTFVLARRYLNAALTPGISLSNIAAITFTDKAAGELYNKVVKLVAERIRESVSSDEKIKLEKIRRLLVSANISTIHSFCINILREYPVEADLDARFVPIDEQLSDELIELSIEETIKILLDDKSTEDDVKYLIRILGSRNRLESELFGLIKQRKNLLNIRNEIYQQDAGTLALYSKEQLDDHFNQIWNKYKTGLLKNISIINQSVLEKNSENEQAISIRELLKELDKKSGTDKILKLLNELSLAILTSNGTVKIRGYLSQDIRSGLESEISTVETTLNELAKIEYSPFSDVLIKDLVTFGKTLLKVFDFVLEKYQQKKITEGYLDYEDILLYTKEILKNENVQKGLSNKFKYILVDEYQDTNEIQYEIFLPILDYLKIGNLFIVGDEKQSIYMFRDAELEIFNRTKTDISSKAGKHSLLELPDSFRMAPGICLFANKLFENLFADPDELFNEVKNTNIVCARTDAKPGSVEFILSNKDQEHPISEAELISRRVRELNSAGTEFRDIAILVRKRKSFSYLETEFIKSGIPFSIIGGRGFYQQQTISDIYNYLSFLSNRGNSVALTGVLRSPFFSIPDSTLFEISLHQGNTYWEKLIHYTSANENLISIKNILQENLKLASSYDLTVLLRKILTDSEYLAVVSSRIDGDQELANIEKLINISRNFSLKGFRNLYDFIEYLNDAITGLEDEAQAAVTVNKDAVQMMTLHQAKGLEFPVVILFNSHESSQKTQIKSRQISISKKFGILTKLPLDGDYLSDYHTSHLNGLYNFIEEKKRIAELKRLLYVGVTRAMDHLIISGDWTDNQKIKSDSFLHLIKSGLKIDFANKLYSLNGDLEFLQLSNGKYIKNSRVVKLEIPINYIVDFDEKLKKSVSDKSVELNIDVNVIEPTLEKDIISATKLSVYNQCPTKYLLTYEYGFGSINELFKQNHFIIPEPENDHLQAEEIITKDKFTENIRSDVKGALIHQLLEREINLNNVDDEITRILVKSGFIDDALIENKKAIISDFKNFIQSDIYKTIQSYKNYKNEYQIYLKDEDIFLFGIIDKIIFAEDELIIVDYKTDDIPEEEIEIRAENYMIQLKFYLYLAKRLFSKYNSFRLMLIFIKHPQKRVIKKYTMTEFFLVKREISDIIKGIIQKNFHKNIEHCGICVYSDKSKNCILK